MNISAHHAVETGAHAGAAEVPVTVIPGDGIGPEIVEAVRVVLAAAGAPIRWEVAPAGMSCLHEAANGLPEATLASIRRTGVALKGPTATPIGGGHKSVNVTIRKALDLYANVRPVQSLPGVATRFGDVDLVIVRENIEDTYGGIEHMQTPDVAQCLKVITRPGSLAIARYAFELARAEGRRRVTCVHKANIHKLTDGLFLACFREVAAGYPEIDADDMLVDNACMQLVTAPERFDVMVMPNLYGDILSDLAAGLVGGLGVAPAGNIGRELAVFEAVHGTAPDIAGAGLANPTALLLAAVQLLRHLGLHAAADRVSFGLGAALAAGVKTRDLGGAAGTKHFVAAILAAMAEAPAHPAAEAASRVVAHHPLPTPATAPAWEVVGADVFIEQAEVPALPERIGPFRLTMISNRGTKVYPGPAPAIAMVDWHRCRYVADAPVPDSAVTALLQTIERDYAWMHVEKLRQAGGVPQYSKAQGE